MGLTQNLSALGQVIVMILMFIGRVGPLTVLLGIRNRKRSEDLQYASTNLIIG